MHLFTVPSTLPNMNDISLKLSFYSATSTAMDVAETYSSQPVKQGRLHLLHAYFLAKEHPPLSKPAGNNEGGETGIRSR